MAAHSVLEHPDISEAAVVVDRDVDELPADGPARGPARTSVGVVVLAAGHSVPSAALDAAELLDVDVRARRDWRTHSAPPVRAPAASACRARSGSGCPAQSSAGIERTSEISAPVIRQPRRRSAINCTRSSGVTLGELRGRDERSSRPSSPSARNRRTHLRAVWALTSTASAAFGERPSLIDDSPHQPPPLVQAEGRVTVELHPVTLGSGGFATPSLQEGADEQPPQALELGGDRFERPMGVVDWARVLRCWTSRRRLRRPTR